MVGGCLGASWLAIDPAKGTGNASLRVSVNTRGLPEGRHTGTIVFTGTGAANSPLSVPVELTVESPCW